MREDVVNSDDDEDENPRVGRPPKIEADKETLSQIESLARLHCTHAEAADVMGVARSTFTMFLTNNEKAEAAWERGRGKGKTSLRRLQFKSAESGNPTMQIWLGKQWLDQKDKIEQNVNMKVSHEDALEALESGNAILSNAQVTEGGEE